MKSVRLLLGLLCLSLLILAPEQVSTRRADAWAIGDLFVGVGSLDSNPGRIDVYDSNGVPRGVSIQIPRGDAGYTTGCYYNPLSQTLFATTFSGGSIQEFDGTTPIRRIGVSDLSPGVLAVESIAFNKEGTRLFAGLPWSSPQLASYDYSPDGGVSNPRIYNLPAGVDRTDARADWIDVAHENGETVVYYTDESAFPQGSVSRVYRYIPATGARTVFAVVPEAKAYALRVLPADGGLLVAGYGHIYRFNMQGQEVARYFGTGPNDGAYFALNITPDGRHFWTASADDDRPNVSGRLHKFNITSSSRPILSVTTGAPTVSGLCLKLEYTAARDVCTDPATGQSITCPKLEICNEGPDDDGDGLNDLSDPDCLPPGTAERCDDGEGADENRNGMINDGCARSTPERTSVNVSFASRPVAGDSITYSAVGLPTGLTMASSGTVSGTTADGAVGSFDVILKADRTAAADSEAPFTWTVVDVNRQPAISSPATASGVEGGAVTIEVTASDIDTSTDGDALTFTASGLPSGLSVDSATGRISGTLGYDTAGEHQITVTATDDHAQRTTVARPLQQSNLSATTTTVLTVSNVSRPPVVVSVPPPGPYPTTGPFPHLQVQGSDPDGDAFTVVGTIVPAPFVVSADGVITLAPNQTLSPGTFTFTVRVEDARGESSAPSTFSLIFVDDRAPVCAAAAPSVAILWPPNHKLVEVAVLGITDPDGDAVSIRIDGIQQDEPVNAPGDGNTDVDGAISADGSTAFVRPERAGTPRAPGDGRIYEILFTATAGSQSCSGMITVGVPHDQGAGRIPVRSPATYNSLTGARIN